MLRCPPYLIQTTFKEMDDKLLDKSELNASGKRLLKKVFATDPPSYNLLQQTHFKNIWGFQDFRRKLDFEKAVDEVLRELFEGHMVSGSAELDKSTGAIALDYKVIRNLAKVIVDLRKGIEDAKDEANEANRRLDRA